MATSEERFLFDPEFVASDCDPNLYDDTDEVDNTVGTYASNYAIGAVGVGVTALFLVQQSKDQRAWAAYFFLTAVGYSVAGVGHQLTDSTEEDGANHAALYTFIPVLLLANFLLLQRCLASVTNSCWARRGLIGVNVLLLAANLALLPMQLVPLGITLVVSYIFAMAVFGFHAVRGDPNMRCSNATKALSILLLTAGLIVQVALAPVCGQAAYETCFRDCPLPNPIQFNHNALFHVIFALGLLLQGVAEFRNPTGPKATTNAEEDDNNKGEADGDSDAMDHVERAVPY